MTCRSRLVMIGGGASTTKPITETEAPNIFAIVRRLTDKADMPMPAIFLSPSQQPNAFATGRNPSHAAQRTPIAIDPAHATAYIFNPLSGRKVEFAGLFRSHPATTDRIARLSSIRVKGIVSR